MNKRNETIINYLTSVPPDCTKAKQYLSVDIFSEEDLASIAYEVVSSFAFWWNYKDYSDDLIGDSLLESLQILLDSGLNPNAFDCKGENLLWELRYVSNKNVAGRALRLLLEHGANPNIKDLEVGESLFEYVECGVSYDEREYLHTVQFWLILMAYGGCYEDGSISIDMCDGKGVDIFKQFELYDYSIEHLSHTDPHFGTWKMHIYNKTTGEEVAVY